MLLVQKGEHQGLVGCSGFFGEKNMQNLSRSAERGMSDGSGVIFDLPRSPLDTEKSCLVFERFSVLALK